MTVQTPAQQEVRAATIRCIGYLIDSVSDLGAEYQEEGKVLMNGLMTLKSQLPAEDPAQAVISEVLGSFASLLKDQFTPYVDSLLPELL